MSGTILVYLCGPVEGYDLSKARSWRRSAMDFMAQHGITCFDPVSAFTQPPSLTAMQHIWPVTIGVIDRCDVLLANLDPQARCFGSIREIQRAKDQGKRVIVVDNHFIEHPSLSTWDVELYATLEEGLHALVGLMPPRETVYAPVQERAPEIREVVRYPTFTAPQTNGVEPEEFEPPRVTIDFSKVVIDYELRLSGDQIYFHPFGNEQGIDLWELAHQLGYQFAGNVQFDLINHKPVQGIVALAVMEGGIRLPADPADIKYVDEGDEPGSHSDLVDYSKD